MSSTNRGGDRNADDFYETPAWCTRAILPVLGPLPGLRILEPSAGRGAIVRELVRAGADEIDVAELDAERLGKLSLDGKSLGLLLRGDFLRMTQFDFVSRFHLVVMNPPFSDAQAHVEHAISLLGPRGTVAALLRLAFVASAKRAPFRKAHPFDLYPLASRPSFTPDGKTDSADYAWFVFHGDLGPGMRPAGGRFAVLEGKGA